MNELTGPPSLPEDDRIRDKLKIPATALSLNAAHDLLKATGAGDTAGIELRDEAGKVLVEGVSEWVKLAQGHAGVDQLASTLEQGNGMSLTVRPSEMSFETPARCGGSSSSSSAGGSTIGSLDSVRAAAADAFELPGTNLAVTVANKDGVVLHGNHQQADTESMAYSYASTDVLVVQLSGRSTWKLCYPGELPPSIGSTEYEGITLPSSYMGSTHQMRNVQHHLWAAAGLPVEAGEVAADKANWLGACAAIANGSGGGSDASATSSSSGGDDSSSSSDGGPHVGAEEGLDLVPVGSDEDGGGGPDVHTMSPGDRMYIPRGVLHSSVARKEKDGDAIAVLTIALETKGSMLADLLQTAAHTEMPAPMLDVHIQAIARMLRGVQAVTDAGSHLGLTTLLTPSTGRLLEPIPANWVADSTGTIPPPPPPPKSDAAHEPAKFVEAPALRQRQYSRLVNGAFLEQMIVFQAGEQHGGGGGSEGREYDVAELVADLAHPDRLVGALTAMGIKRGKAAAAAQQSCPAQ